MIGNSWTIRIAMIIMVILGFIYNVVSATLISRTSAVVRTLMEAFRAFLIWIVQLLIFYTFRTNDTLHHYIFAGEEWGTGSYIQLAGFILMTFAVLAYNKILKYPCYSYEYDQYIDTPKGAKDVGEEAQFEKEKEFEIITGNKGNEETSVEIRTDENDITIENNVEELGNFDISDDSIRSMSLGSDSIEDEKDEVP